MGHIYISDDNINVVFAKALKAFLSVLCLINLAYPEAFKFDMVKETREFYKLFLDLELTDEQIYKILGRGAE